MKARRGFDQTLAWIISVVCSASLFSGLFFLSRYMAENSEAHTDEEMHDSDSDEADDSHHGKKAHGSEHSEAAEDDKEHGHAAEGEHAEHEEHSAAAGHGKEPEHGHEEADEHHAAAPVHGEHADVDANDEEGGHGKKKAKQPTTSETDAEDETPKEHQDSTRLAAKTGHGKGPEWSYSGAEGPQHWGQLSEGHVACGVGKFQSPVDLGKSFKTKQLHPIEFHYESTSGVLANDGHGIDLDFGGGSYVLIEDVRYDLVQMQFHAPSEHKIEGIPYDMEVQLLHKNKKGQMAMIAALVEEAQTKNAAIVPLWQKLPKQDDKLIIEGFNPAGLLPKKRDYYFYEGSLTTPPCTEGVKWLVLEDTLRFSARQIDDFIGLVRFNARPVQPLYSRKIEKNW